MTGTVVGELVVQHHATVAHGRVAVAERHADAVVDLGACHVGGDGKHVDSRDMDAILLSAGRQTSGVNTEESRAWILTGS